MLKCIDNNQKCQELHAHHMAHILYAQLRRRNKNKHITK